MGKIKFQFLSLIVLVLITGKVSWGATPESSEESSGETEQSMAASSVASSVTTSVSIADTISKVDTDPLTFPIPPLEIKPGVTPIRKQTSIPTSIHQVAEGVIRLGGENRNRMFDLNLDDDRKEAHFYRVTNLFIQKTKRRAPADSRLIDLDSLADLWSPKSKNLRASLSDFDLTQPFCAVSHDFGRLNEEELPELRLPNVEAQSHHVKALYNTKKVAYGTAVVIQAKDHLRISCFKFAKDKLSPVEPLSATEIRSTLDLTDDDFQLQFND